MSNAQEWTLLRPPRLRRLDDEEQRHAFEMWVYHRAQVARPLADLDPAVVGAHMALVRRQLEDDL